MKYGKICLLLLILIVLSAKLSFAVELQVLVIGHGYVQGENFSCIENCSKSYEKGTVIHFKALPFPDSQFTGWKVNGAPHEGVITLNEDTVLSAVFERTSDPMLEDGITVYWYNANGGREYARITLDQMFIRFENREKWDVATDKEYDETIQDIARMFHPQAEIISQTPYYIILKSSETLEKEQWFDRLFAIQELNTVLWTAPVLNMCLKEPCSMTLGWNEMSVYFPQSYTEAQIKSIEQEYGLQRVEPLAAKPNSFIYQVGSPLEAIETANRLYESGIVELAVPSISEEAVPTSELPDDKFFKSQWHLLSQTEGEDINVLSAWEASKGSGVTVAIVDDGVELAHEDLAPVENENAHRDFLEGDHDPIDNDKVNNLPEVVIDPAGSPLSPECPSACHGTAVAGVAVAKGFNQTGVSGVAPLAKLIGYRIGLDPYRVTRQRLYNGLFIGGQNGEIDVYNNSYGGSITLALVEGNPDRHAEVEVGAGNNNIIYVWSAGNEPDRNTNYYGFSNSRYTITVGASGEDRMAHDYSTPGATVLVNAPSGLYTTDREGRYGYNKSSGEFTLSAHFLQDVSNTIRKEGGNTDPLNPLYPPTCNIFDTFANREELYLRMESCITKDVIDQYKNFFDDYLDAYVNDGNYLESFSGTSAAAPVVSGVTALMLGARRQKEPDKPLKWRDVQHILIETAHKNQGAAGEALEQDWKDNTNTAGYSHLYKYGFGRVDAGAAVAKAIEWDPVPEETATQIYTTPAIAGLGSAGIFDSLQQSSLTVSENLRVEFVEVTFSSDHPKWGDLQIALTSPSTCLTLTEVSLQSLRDEGFPESILESLTSLQNQEFCPVAAFWEAVEEQLGAENTATHRRTILKYASSGFSSILAEPINSPEIPYDEWKFGTRRHFGESSQGEWTLHVQDKKQSGNKGKWYSWSLQIYGTEYTEEQRERSYVREVKVSAGEETIYHAGWESVVLEDGEEPQIAFAWYAEPQEPVAGTAAQIEIHTSEALQGREDGEESPSVRLAGTEQQALKPCEGHQDGTCWQGTLTVPDTEESQLIIQGTDPAGKPLLAFADTRAKTLSDWTEDLDNSGDSAHRVGRPPALAWELATPNASACVQNGTGVDCLFHGGQGRIFLSPVTLSDIGGSSSRQHQGTYRPSHVGDEGLTFAVNMTLDASLLHLREPERREMWCPEVPDDAPGEHGPPPPSEPETQQFDWELTASPNTGANRCMIQLSLRSKEGGETQTIQLDIEPHTLCDTLQETDSDRYEFTIGSEWKLVSRSLYSEMLEEKDAWRRRENEDMVEPNKVIDVMFDHIGEKYENGRTTFERANPDWKKEPEDILSLPIIEPGEEDFLPMQLLSMTYDNCRWWEHPACGRTMTWNMYGYTGCVSSLYVCVEPDTGDDCQGHVIHRGLYRCDVISRYALWEGMASCQYEADPVFFCFTLSPSAYERLRDEGLPSAVLELLLPLQRLRFCSEPAFSEAVTAVLGPDNFEAFGARILAAARESMQELPEEVSAPQLSRTLSLYPMP